MVTLAILVTTNTFKVVSVYLNWFAKSDNSNCEAISSCTLLIAHWWFVTQYLRSALVSEHILFYRHVNEIILRLQIQTQSTKSEWFHKMVTDGDSKVLSVFKQFHEIKHDRIKLIDRRLLATNGIILILFIASCVTEYMLGGNVNYSITWFVLCTYGVLCISLYLLRGTVVPLGLNTSVVHTHSINFLIFTLLTAFTFGV